MVKRQISQEFIEMPQDGNLVLKHVSLDFTSRNDGCAYQSYTLYRNNHKTETAVTHSIKNPCFHVHVYLILHETCSLLTFMDKKLLTLIENGIKYLYNQTCKCLSMETVQTWIPTSASLAFPEWFRNLSGQLWGKEKLNNLWATQSTSLHRAQENSLSHSLSFFLFYDIVFSPPCHPKLPHATVHMHCTAPTSRAPSMVHKTMTQTQSTRHGWDIMFVHVPAFNKPWWTPCNCLGNT